MPVRTDPECGRVMDPVLLGGKIKWVCYCGNSYPGSPEDTLLAQGDLRPSAQSYTTGTYLKAAPTDRVAPRVLRDCGRCGMDTMVAVRGNRMELIYLCSHCDAPGAAKAAAKPAKSSKDSKAAKKAAPSKKSASQSPKSSKSAKSKKASPK